jgi:hypothetical protein
MSYLNYLTYIPFSFYGGDSVAGTYYRAGYYKAPVSDANLTQASPTIVLGSVNVSYATHAFAVSGGNGTTDAGDLVLTASGTSITDAGVRTSTDSEQVVPNALSSPINTYYETIKKWIGAVTWTLTSSTGPNFSYTFNAGFAKYEDFGNKDFVVSGFQVVGDAGVNDSGFNVELLHHKAAGWTYHATAFVPGSSVLANMNTDHGAEKDLFSGDGFAYKRTNLSTAIGGNDSEGVIVRITTGTANSINNMDITVAIMPDLLI